MRRILPVIFLCAGTSLSSRALAANICLTQAGDPHLSFPGTGKPYVVAVKSDGNGGYNLSLCSPSDLDISWLTSYGFGDFNHDGWEDLMFGTASNSGGAVEVLINDASGSGTVVLHATLATGAGAAPDEVQALDLNGDGRDDILTANGSDGTFSVMLNDGSGAFPTVKQYAMGSDVTLLASADVNGDGFPDMITESAKDQTVSVALNNGDGTFAPPTTYGIGGPVSTVSVQDLNGDGHPDIFVSSVIMFGSGYILPPNSSTPAGSQKLLNNGDGTFSVSPWQSYSTGSSGSSGNISISGGGVTVSATAIGTLFGSSAGIPGTTPIAVTSGGVIKLPPTTTPTATNTGGKSGGGVAGKPPAKAASSGGGGPMEWFSLTLLALTGFLRRKRG